MAEPSVVLALDTSTVVHVGLARGEEVLGTATVADRLAHVEQLTPLIDRCLADEGIRPCDLTSLVVGLGPGPFTGLRVAIASAQVLALVWRLPLRGVCSLDVIATQHAREHGPHPGDFLAASDARRGEVYWARYSSDGHRVEGPYVSRPGDVPALPVLGPGADLYPDHLEAALGPRTLDPGVLAVAGPSLPDAGRSPLYLRRPDAAEPTRRKSVLGSAR